jgi:hypothetical protein
MSATQNVGKKDVTFKSDALQNESFTEENAKKSNTMDFDKAKKAFEDKDAYKKAFGGFQNLKLGNNVLSSDETLKKIYGDDLADSIIENFAKINAIDFTRIKSDYTTVKSKPLHAQQGTVQGTEPYYVRMGVAWLLATALAKFTDQTRAFVRSSALPADVIKLYVRKARESFRTRMVEAL